jgi:Flp pilus assembly pilin Flp
MSRFLSRLLADDIGQDLIEYALLTSFVGLVGIASIGFISNAIQYVYGTWTGGTNNLWESPDPAS